MGLVFHMEIFQIFSLSPLLAHLSYRYLFHHSDIHTVFMTNILYEDMPFLMQGALLPHHTLPCKSFHFSLKDLFCLFA